MFPLPENFLAIIPDRKLAKTKQKQVTSTKKHTLKMVEKDGVFETVNLDDEKIHKEI